MAEGDRLRALQMREARHHRVGMGLGLFGQRRLQRVQLAVDLVDGVPHPELEVGRHLVVARARGVKPARGVADQLLEPRLDMRVDVLQRARKRERSGGDFRRDRVQARDDLLRILGRNDALIGKHPRVRSAAGDVLGEERLVEVDRGVDLLHDGVRLVGKPAAP